MGTEIEAALEVIQVEMDGLQELKSALSDPNQPIFSDFAKAVDVCDQVKGRVIVTGMGKSGHVARKIAATLASTGTRASYVHPGEASHGDLGMISDDDVVIALSNSGDTPELSDIIGYAHRFNIPLISMTAGPDSALARNASILLLIPKAKEACRATKAPTTSTTLMMALGDALAVAILRQKGFSAADFHVFHPGGKLGAALKKVTDLAHHRDVPICSPKTSVTEAVGVINAKGFGCVGVVDEAGKIVGIVTDGDLRRRYAAEPIAKRVEEIMSPDPYTVREDSLAADALNLLTENKITSVFIVNDAHQPIGLVHVHDCLSVGVI